MVISVVITEKTTTVASNVSADALRNIFMIVLKAGSDKTTFNHPVLINSSGDYLDEFKTLSTVVKESINAIFNNYESTQLHLVNAEEDSSAIDEKDDKTLILDAIANLEQINELDLGVLVIPEFSGLKDSSDPTDTGKAQAIRTAVFNAAESLTKKKKWMHYANVATTSNTPALASTEAKLYKSQRGHSALFYGGVMYSDQVVPMSVIAAAIAVRSTST
ncbi:MAG: hypothetical protein F6K65_22120, partial [Moorea sp. SIO3C2]|nr:hypothetical protein [Moorena sp. SIO3C2]